MFRYDNDEVGVHWAMPGGGLEPDETPLEAAERELAEETGWTDVAPGICLFTWEHDYTRAGVAVRQSEQVFLAHGPRRAPASGLAAAHAADAILSWRWWTPADLAGDTEPLWPPQLPHLLARLGTDRAPAGPVDLGYVQNKAVGSG
jgi:8-oxo-dGTP pyrophosphatase MutT (NUDIX family)